MANKKRFSKNNKEHPARIIPYGKQLLDNYDRSAVLKVLKSDWLTQGPVVQGFEVALARTCGSKYAIAVANGTAGLHLAYLAAGIGPGDEVITTPNTFVATTNMLLAVGAKPVFCDIRLDNYNIDETKIEKLITPRTKAIVPVHFGGHPCEMDTIMRIAKKHGLFVIEDACHALGAKYKKRKIGSIGDMTIFSFHPVKSITTGEGGAILTDDPSLNRKLLHLRSHGIEKNSDGFNVMTRLGYNYRLSDIHSALGLSQLKKLNSFLRLRRSRVHWYSKALANIPEIILPKEQPATYSAWHLYVIRVKDSKLRLPLMRYLKSSGIGINLHYPAIYSHPFYRKSGHMNTALKNTDAYNASCVTIPLYPSLTINEIKYICDAIITFFR